MKKILISLLTLMLLTGCQSKTVSSPFEINFYSVGNADAALVECDGRYMMIDCGSGDVEVKDDSNIYKIDRYLQEKDITHFDYIVCTHPDNDHYKGFLDILKGDGQTRKYDTFYCSTKASIKTTQEFNSFCKSIKEYSSKKVFKGIKVPDVGDTFKLGDANVEVLAVNSNGEGIGNDASIVLMITYGANKFLFTGDAEVKTEKELNSKKIKCDVLKVAHHGGSKSTYDDFLDKANPSYAILSVGNNNQYDHPSILVIDRLEKHIDRNKILRTSSGKITCTSDGINITIKQNGKNYVSEQFD